MQQNMKKIKVLIVYSKPTGCYWYRQIVPLALLASFEYIELSKIERQDDIKIQQQYIDENDIIIFGREYSDIGLQLLEYAKLNGKKVIYDVDDNLIEIPYWNPANVFFSKK